MYEKAPWILLNMILPLTLLASYFLNNFINRKSVVVIFLILSFLFVWTSINWNYFHSSDPAEPGMQAAQPRSDFNTMISKIDETASKYGYVKIQLAKVGEGKSEQLTGTQVSQLLWLLRHYKNIEWYATGNLSAPIIIAHGNYADQIEKNLTGYERFDTSAMGWYWWEPKDFLSLEYLLFRKVNKTVDGDRIVLFRKT